MGIFDIIKLSFVENGSISVILILVLSLSDVLTLPTFPDSKALPENEIDEKGDLEYYIEVANVGKFESIFHKKQTKN